MFSLNVGNNVSADAQGNVPHRHILLLIVAFLHTLSSQRLSRKCFFLASRVERKTSSPARPVVDNGAYNDFSRNRIIKKE